MWMHAFSPKAIDIKADGAELEGFSGSSASVTESSFGQVTDTVITIKGKVALAMWQRNKQIVLLGGEEFHGVGDALEEGWSQNEGETKDVLQSYFW